LKQDGKKQGVNEITAVKGETKSTEGIISEYQKKVLKKMQYRVFQEE